MMQFGALIKREERIGEKEIREGSRKEESRREVLFISYLVTCFAISLIIPYFP